MRTRAGLGLALTAAGAPRWARLGPVALGPALTLSAI